MILGRIAGTVVATRKDEKLEGKKLLLVKTIDPETRAEYVVLKADLYERMRRVYEEVDPSLYEFDEVKPE